MRGRVWVSGASCVGTVVGPGPLCPLRIGVAVGRVVVVSNIVKGDTTIVVEVVASVVDAIAVVVDVGTPGGGGETRVVDVTAWVVEGAATVVGPLGNVVEELGTAEVGGLQPVTGDSDADAVESTDLSRLRIVNVTVPLDGAGPLASQIGVVPDSPIVS